MSKLNKNVIWVIIIMGLLIMAQSEEKKTVGEVVNRVLPNQAIINQEVTITLTSSNIPSQYFSIVRDNIPTGWTYISGGSLEGNQVKGILSTLTGNSLTYTLKAPSSAATSTFSGTYQFSDALSPSTIGGINSIPVIASSCNPPCPSVNTIPCGQTINPYSGCFGPCSAGTQCSTGTCQNGQCIISSGEVKRTLPASASLNQNVGIILTAQNTQGDYFVITRDNIPTGWTYISGGSLEGNQVKGILSTLTGNSLTYTLKAPSSAATSTFSGTYQFSGAATPSTTIGDLSVITSSSGGCTPSQCSSECKTGSCASGNCVAQNKADGTACSTGTCQSGVCESQKTCAQLLGNICASGQQCTGGTMTDSSDTADLCCVGGTCEDTTITEQSCEEIKGCEFWEACNKTESKCTTAPWVYLVGAFMGMILLINSLK